jgi:hypothetical protein
MLCKAVLVGNHEMNIEFLRQKVKFQFAVGCSIMMTTIKLAYYVVRRKLKNLVLYATII